MSTGIRFVVRISGLDVCRYAVLDRERDVFVALFQHRKRAEQYRDSLNANPPRLIGKKGRRLPLAEGNS